MVIMGKEGWVRESGEGEWGGPMEGRVGEGSVRTCI